MYPNLFKIKRKLKMFFDNIIQSSMEMEGPQIYNNKYNIFIKL
jgi:hypothetical protein